jgi:hypothetical protein
MEPEGGSEKSPQSPIQARSNSALVYVPLEEAETFFVDQSQAPSVKKPRLIDGFRLRKMPPLDQENAAKRNAF